MRNMDRRTVLRWLAPTAAGTAGCARGSNDTEGSDQSQRGELTVVESVWTLDREGLVIEGWVANTAANVRTGVVRVTVDFPDGDSIRDEQQITVDSMQSPTPKLTFFLDTPGDEMPSEGETPPEDEVDVSIEIVDQWVGTDE